MKVAGTLESLKWTERGGKLKLGNCNRSIWIPESAKMKVKGLEEGDQVAVEANRGQWYSPSVRENTHQSVAVEVCPDLKNPPMKLVWLTYKFRIELLKNYQGQHMIELANTRCDITMPGFRPDLGIVEDLLASCRSGRGRLRLIMFPISTVELGSVGSNDRKS